MVMIYPTNRPFAIMSAPEKNSVRSSSRHWKSGFLALVSCLALSALSPRQTVLQNPAICNGQTVCEEFHYQFISFYKLIYNEKRDRPHKDKKQRRFQAWRSTNGHDR